MGGLGRGLDPQTWTISSPATVERFFRLTGKRVVYFAGYGELGYHDRGIVPRVAEQVLGPLAPDDVVVHGSTLLRAGGEDGIAAVYAVAKDLGFTTTGVYPSVAMAFGRTHRVSPRCDHVFFVDNATWGGLLDGSRVPSPTLRLHLRVSHEMVAVGGGRHTADELRAFAAQGRAITFFCARMNTAAMLRWCRRTRRPPLDPDGAAQATWRAMARRCRR